MDKILSLDIETNKKEKIDLIENVANELLKLSDDDLINKMKEDNYNYNRYFRLIGELKHGKTKSKSLLQKLL